MNIVYAFSVQFVDHAMSQKIDCNNSKSQNWSDISSYGFTQAQCEAIIASETASEISTLHGPMSSDGIFVRVYNYSGSQSLNEWLLANYKVANTELENYTPGKAITLGGLSGFTSQIACCTAYDLSYVVKKSSYIFQLGTQGRLNGTGDSRENYDNTTLKTIAETFKFSN